MKDRTERTFDCQRAITRREALSHEFIEELAQRLHAKPLTDLARKEGAEPGGIMWSRWLHLDAATNDTCDDIIPSCA